jgi:hypothetical protein
MQEFLEFLKFCWENKDDKRFTITKKVKYGWTSYYFGWDVQNGITIHVDSRNQVLELSKGYDTSILIEDPYIYGDMFNKCEIEYERRLDNNLNRFVESFFNKLDDEDKDLSRIWKFGKMDFLESEDDV